MKKSFNTSVNYLVVLCAALLFWTSCKKEDSGMENPTILSGPDSVAAGGTVILEGKDLAEMRSLVFEFGSTPAKFNPVLNNPNAIIFRVPDSTWGGPTNIILTNSAGTQLKYPLVVVTPPVVQTISSTDYLQDMEILLTGNNLQFVNEVALVNMSDEPTGEKAEIISQSKKEMVIKLPASTEPRVKLKITNTSSTIITTKYFVNIDLTKKIFLDGYGSHIENWSWAGKNGPSTEQAFMGTHSMKLDMTTASKGGAMRLVNKQEISFDNYTNVSFWMKGADVAQEYNFLFQKDAATVVESQKITIPPHVWTYFTFPLQIWKNKGMNGVWGIVFQLQSDVGKVVYLDNLVFN